MERTLIAGILLPLALAFILSGLGLGLSLRAFQRVVARPRALLVGLICQSVILPLASYAVAIGFRLSPELAVGLMLLSASPGAVIASLYSHLARGDVALSLALTVVSSVLGIFLMPAIASGALHLFMVVENTTPTGASLDNAAQVLAVVIVPVALGMFVRAKKPALADRLDRPVRLASAIFLVLVVGAALAFRRISLADSGEQVALPVLTFNLISITVGYFVPLLANLPKPQAVALGMEMGIRNCTLAIAVATRGFESSRMAIPPVIYSLMMFFTAAAFSVYVLRGSPPDSRRARARHSAGAAFSLAILIASIGLRPPLAEISRGGRAFKWLVAGAVLVTAVSCLVTLRAWYRSTLEPSGRRIAQALLVSVGSFYFGLLLWPYDPSAVRGLACVSLAALAVGVAWPRIEKSGFRKASYIARVIAINLILTGLGLEASLRVLAKFQRNSPWLMQADSSSAEIMDKFRLRPGQQYYGFTVNSRGEIDGEFLPKKQGECLVVSIADSFTQAIGGHEYHFTSVAERDLHGCQIYNMGVACIGVRQYLYLLKFEALDLHPDLIFVNIFVGNDFGDFVQLEPQPAARRWLDRDNLLLYSVSRRLWRSREKLLSGSSQAGSSASSSGGSSAAKQELYPWLDDPLLEPPELPEQEFMAIETERARQITTARLDPFAPKMFETLNEIREAAGAIPLRFVIIPDEFQVEDELWARVSEPLEPTAERDRPQRVLREYFDKNGVSYLDLLPELRAAQPLRDGRKHVYLNRNTHFNPRGHRIAGEAIARFLAPSL